jgi:hypothetical protein
MHGAFTPFDVPFGPPAPGGGGAGRGRGWARGGFQNSKTVNRSSFHFT